MSEPPSNDLVNDQADRLYEKSVYTKRQCEVLALKEDGYSPFRIAEELGISRTMVNTHIRNAQDQLERAAWTVMESDVIVFSVRTGSGTKMLADMDSILELKNNE